MPMTQKRGKFHVGEEKDIRRFAIVLEYDENGGLWDASALGWTTCGYPTAAEAARGLLRNIHDFIGEFK